MSYDLHTEQLQDKNYNYWSYSMKRYMESLGYAYLINNFDPDINHFPALKQRSRDLYVQVRSEKLCNLPKLE